MAKAIADSLRGDLDCSQFNQLDIPLALRAQLLGIQSNSAPDFRAQLPRYKRIAREVGETDSCLPFGPFFADNGNSNSPR
jgi:hypothetical protein